MRIEVLGCSGGIGPGRRTTSFLVNDDILIDGGTGLAQLELEQMAGIRHILLTHSHLDHVAGIPFMLDAVFTRLREPVVIHAQQATIDALCKHVFNWVIWPDFAVLPEPDRPVVRYEPLEPGASRVLEGLRVEMVEVNHSVPAVGFVLHDGQRTFAFSGDTSTSDTLWEDLNALDRLDMLIIEAAFPNDEEALSNVARHYCPRTLAADLVRLRHRPDIYLTHFKPGLEDRILAECREALPDRNLQPLATGDVFEL